MKKCLLTVVLVLVVSINAFAADFSVGITAGGWGPTFGRGDVYKELLKEEGRKKAGVKYSSAFAPVAQVVGQVDIIPYFGIELGIGYSMKSIGFTYDTTDDTGKKVVGAYKYSFNQLSVPLLLKGQYEIADMVNIYLAVGPRFNFNIANPTMTQYTDGKKDKAEGTDKNPAKMEKEQYNMFDMDLSFALGAEYKIANAHYVGLRVGYDMNLLGTIKEGKYDAEKDEYKYSGREKFYVDDLAISLTYRYKFGQ